MNPMFLRYLIDGLHPTECLQSNLGFELRQVQFALLCFSHWIPVSLDSVPLKHLSQISGPLQFDSSSFLVSGGIFAHSFAAESVKLGIDSIFIA
jgi:hypothetical protein